MKKNIFSLVIVLAAWLPLASQEVILHEDFSLGYSNYFQSYFVQQSMLLINNQVATFTGGTGTTWVGNGNATTPVNAWADNIQYRASLSTYIDATNYNAIELQVKFRQTASSSVMYSWFRVLANGVQQSDNCGRTNFHPVSFNNDIYQSAIFDLSDYGGQDFILSLQSSCRYANLDQVIIDDIRIIYNNTALSLTLPYTQNFDSTWFPSSWVSCPDSFSFGWQPGDFSNLGIPPHGFYMASINYPNDTALAVSKLISPYFNFESLDTVHLNFDVFADHPFAVLVSTGVGENWNDTILQQTSTSGWENISLDISQFAGINLTRIAFSNSDQDDLSSLLAIDHFSLAGSSLATHDIGVSTLISPTPSPQFGANEPIGIRIKNYSSISVSNFQVGFQLNGGFAYTDTILSSVLPNDSLDYYFTQTANMSLPGNNTFTAWAVKAYDINLMNDTLQVLLVSTYPTITSFPYLQSFETTNYWTSGGANSSWANGIPTGSFISSASQGQKAWVTNLSGSYNMYEASWVRSPVFDFSNLTSPEMAFDILFECEDFEDGACFQYSTNEGSTWTTLGVVGSNPTWYNSSWVTGLVSLGTYNGWSQNPYSSWQQTGFDLSFLSGQQGVRFRFFFGSTENFNALEGFAFDNFRIFDIQGHDIGITALVYPTGDCTMSNSEPVVVEVRNFGLNPVSGFDLTYQLNNNIPVTDFVSTSIPADSSIWHTFSTPVDLSSTGLKSFFLSLNDTGDQAAFNDTLTVALNFTLSKELPYYENFQAGILPEGWSRSQAPGSDGWLISSDNSSLYFPVPPHTTYASSNDDTCFCDMSDDKLITPAFDFSQYATINLSFESYLTGGLNSSGSVLASTDCGFTWDLVSYVSGNPALWQNINIDLGVYSGYSSVKIAFLHNDNGSWASGFAVDDVYVTGTGFSQTQAIPLHIGWGIMSSYIDPVQPLLDSVLANVNSNLTILKNGNGLVYWPNFNLNMIGNHTIGEGYQYKMIVADTLFVTGSPVFPQYTTLDIPSNWSIIGYLRNVPGLATDMMASVVSNIIIMKDEDGLVFWPAFSLNAIGNMKSGKGYQIKMANPASFYYPANP
ncbi:MAG: hypothetical protein K9H64_10910 [Bacteroidales bacterium]|nr:hypothetical protein [Bacteroidales bacterium]MCF8456392.1 hypothetical protein [Bacteroidales bacterium]